MVGKLTIERVKQEFTKDGYKLLSIVYKNQNQMLEYVCPNGHKRYTTWKNWKKGSRCLVCKNQSTRPSIDDVRNSFVDEGYTILSKEYVNNKKKLDYICPLGHKNSITWVDWNIGGYRCPDCANNKKLSIEKIISDFKYEDYTFISGEYVNNTSILKVKCPKGHEFETSRVKWTSGWRCPICHADRVNIDVVRESFDREGYKLLSKEYINACTKLKYICPNGHEHNITWAAWQQGGRCFYCRNDKNRVPIDEIDELFDSDGYVFVRSSYDKDKLKYICPNYHDGSVTLGNWKLGSRCPYCYGNARVEFDDIKNDIEKEGYKVIGTLDDVEFKNNRTKLHLICPNGHDYFASWFDWNSNKVRCYKCKDHGSSLQEQELIDYIKKNIDVYIETHDRYLIKPYELDIIIPDKKIAIEYCGLYWHSELAGKDKYYHVNKLNMCEKIGYRLLTIFEDEFINKKDIVLNRIKYILGNSGAKKVYARQCIIKEIPTDLVSEFCNKHHIQGYTGSSIKLGAFYGNDLVSVMTFSKPSISKGNFNKNNNVWELSRFCSDSSFVVVGIASKLLKFFDRNYEWNSVFSYADRRWSDGNLYKTIGFNFDNVTATNYWYILPGITERKHRFALRKRPDEPKDITEWELRKAQGLNRIWDCGNLKYVMCNGMAEDDVN